MQKSKGNENENEMIRNTKTKTKIVHVEKRQRNEKQFADDETTTKRNAKIKTIASLLILAQLNAINQHEEEKSVVSVI